MDFQYAMNHLTFHNNLCPHLRFLIAQLFTRQELMDCGENLDRLQVLYFLKIISLFEQFGYNDFVIELANTALEICDEKDPNRVSA